MAMRVFEGKLRIVIDETEINEIRMGSVTMREVRQYVGDAMTIGFDDEEYSNNIGLTSLEVDLEGMRELPDDEVEKLYNRTPPDENIVMEQTNAKPLRRKKRR